MPALSLDHWNVYCKDLKATVRFYERYVGLYDGDRPPFPFPGAWLYAGEKPILHLVSETGRKDHGSGAIDHIAINCIDLQRSLDFYERILGFKKLQTVDCGDFDILYFALPNGARLELFDYRGRNPEVVRRDDDNGLRHVAFQVDDVAAHEKLLRAIEEFTEGTPQTDDVTFVIVENIKARIAA